MRAPRLRRLIAALGGVTTALGWAVLVLGCGYSVGDGRKPHADSFEAMVRRSESIALSAESVACMSDGLADPDPLIRGFASQAIARSAPDAADRLAALLEDPDAIVRAIALKSVAASAPERAMAGFHDESELVRRSALDSVLMHANMGDLESSTSKTRTACNSSLPRGHVS